MAVVWAADGWRGGPSTVAVTDETLKKAPKAKAKAKGKGDEQAGLGL